MCAYTDAVFRAVRRGSASNFEGNGEAQEWVLPGVSTTTSVSDVLKQNHRQMNTDNPSFIAAFIAKDKLETAEFLLSKHRNQGLQVNLSTYNDMIRAFAMKVFTDFAH
jgi:hypothetical protein